MNLSVGYALVGLLVAGAVLGQIDPAQLQPLADARPDALSRLPDEAVRIAAATASSARLSLFEGLPGGTATVTARSGNDAFLQPSANLDPVAGLDFQLGAALFAKTWVQAPASTLASDGLGPIYNARSCQACHLQTGRSHPPEEPGGAVTSMVLRLSIPGDFNAAQIGDRPAPAPDPVYGEQLQIFAVNGIPAEGQVTVSWTDAPIALSDGQEVLLRQPGWRVENLAWGPLHADTMLSARVGPQLIGLGLLEAIPAADILALSDEDDADGDQISGRASIVLSGNEFMIGRFGWKAAMATLADQAAAAFADDIGISTPIEPAPWGDCTLVQTQCQTAPHGSHDVRETELDQAALDLVVLYLRNLAVPARTESDDPQVLRGKAVFHATGCAACHQPAFVTARLPGNDPASFQLIWPYSDLLLHDMGPGLADHQLEREKTDSEWRTAPLWGIGMTAQISGVQSYLHDGRASSLLEAVLWHGGEARRQRDAVVAMVPSDRADLIRFLESL